MSRHARTTPARLVNFRLMLSIDNRLTTASKEIGKSRTYIVENALFAYLNRLDKDLGK